MTAIANKQTQSSQHNFPDELEASPPIGSGSAFISVTLLGFSVLPCKPLTKVNMRKTIPAALQSMCPDKI